MVSSSRVARSVTIRITSDDGFDFCGAVGAVDGRDGYAKEQGGLWCHRWGCTAVRMRASDAAESHLTDECADAATASSSRVSQLYANASVAFKFCLSEAGACVRAALANLGVPKHRTGAQRSRPNAYIQHWQR